MSENEKVVTEVPEETQELNQIEEQLDALDKEKEAEEKPELTEEEKHALFIQQLKDSRKTFHPKKHYGVEYHQKRRVKNKEQRKSRKANR